MDYSPRWPPGSTRRRWARVAKHMERLNRPDRTEHAKIRRAFRASTFMKWGFVPLMLVAGLVAKLVAFHSSHRYLGLFVLLLACALVVFGYSRARCPRCGQIWWSRTGLFLVAPVLILFGGEDETDSFVCRRCGLDIGFGLRE
jgi:hypothetical protein